MLEVMDISPPPRPAAAGQPARAHEAVAARPARRGRDPRLYQITVLGLLLAYGVLALDFPVGAAEIATLVGTALATQLLCGRVVGIRFDYRSPLISALSLCLLARASSLAPLALTALVAIASKFLIRRRGKHVFNPTNFGLVAVALLSGSVWISPGQWGSGANLAFLLACLGGLVVHRAARSDVTWAFLAAYAALLFGRAAWLGDPLTIPLHALDSGALLVFAFFMISDPKTTPDSRAGRIVWAALVAAGAGFVHFGLYRPNGFLFSLVAGALAVPLIDRLLPGPRYHWPDGTRPATLHRRRCRRLQPLHPTEVPTMPDPPSRTLPDAAPVTGPSVLPALLAALVALGVGAGAAQAFCGFYVAKADTRLFNQASQVVLTRDGDRTVLTMANDFRGDPDEFAIVIPVPTFLERDQIHVADQALIDHLDAYTAPRLVEYFDADPCGVVYELGGGTKRALPSAQKAVGEDRARALGVVIEAKYTVGEYDILILSAEESRGLETWLRESGYRMPPGAARVLGSYLKQGMRFFVARVNLGEKARLGFTNLRPLQVAYESPKFMLPIRLGTVNADGPQELFIYTLTRRGRVETTNYRTVKLPTGMDVPTFVRDEFGDFYRDLFGTQVERQGMRTVFLEYAWDMNWCDPCAADPLSPEELRNLGVFWLGESSRRGPAREVFVTRLHVRYDAEHFPDDLRFQETADRSNFQGRYVLRHPWTGTATCQAAGEYRRGLPGRWEREAQTLARLTGWQIEEIRRRMGFDETLVSGEAEPWWRRLWKGP